MSWIENFVRPRIKALISKDDIPDNMWCTCPSCKSMLYLKELQENLNVCSSCSHHMRMDAKARLEMLFDEGEYNKIKTPKGVYDPLKFKDRKRYTERLKDSKSKTGNKDVVLVGEGAVGGIETVIAVFDFAFMGGSMGNAVGAAILKAAEVAVDKKAPLVVVPSSGGARMQEGMISLMQMPRTTIAVEMVKEAGLPYVVILTDPTTGGVTASFAMLGDIHIAEPGAQISFAGKRVIQETIREALPQGFQTAEFLKEHGMVDIVVPRSDLKQKLSDVLNLLTISYSR